MPTQHLGIGGDVRGGVLAVLGGAVLLGCVADVDDPPASADADLVIELDDIAFVPDRLEIDAGTSITVELRNVGGIVHDLVLDDGWDSGLVDPGAARAVELGPFGASTTGWCSVPGHRDAGMELELVIRSTS